MALVAPNAVQMLKLFGFSKTGKRDKEVIRRAQKRLLEKGLLTRNKDGYIKLSEEGEKELRKIERNEFKINKPKKWDGKWRLLIFDIPEKMKRVREKVRNTLSSIGFVWLQDSVWVYPYDCEDLVVLLKTDFQVGKSLLYLIVEEMENDRHLRDHFDL